MVFMLGKHFPDTQLVRKALTSLYGISGTSTTLRATASRAPAALPTVLHTHASASAAASQPTSTKSSSTSAPPPLAATAPLSPKRHNLLSRLLAAHYIHPTARLGDVSETRLTALTASLAELTIEMDLRRRVREDIARLRDMGSYRGRRHALGLPVRGQKTKGQTNTARKLNRIERRG